MKYIPLTQGKQAIVDDEDFERVNQWKWCFHKGNNEKNAYAFRFNSIRMHRFILNVPKGLHVDHINGDTLDNRKSNLRMCTNSENQLNSYRHRDNKVMGFRVKEYKNKVLYEAQKHGAYLGLFSTPELAHQAYLNSINPLVKNFRLWFYKNLSLGLIYRIYIKYPLCKIQ